MNSLQRQSDDLQLRAWRRGEMDATAEDAFEARLFFEPDLLASAQADQAMEEGLRLVRCESPELLSPDAECDSDSVENGSVEPAVASIAPMPANLSGARRSRPVVSGPWSMLLAAGLGAAAVLPFVGQTQMTAQTAGNLEWVSLDVRRGTESEMITIAPRASAGVIAMELAAPAELSAPLSLSLIAVGSEEATLVIPDLVPTDGLLSFAFARSQLPAGDYRIEVAGSDAQRQSGEAILIRYLPAGD